MRELELLAPARNADIGIAAIDCGADAVYIAGPEFGARQAAGNSMDEIRRLCEHAHRFGARVFMTLNTILFDNEIPAAKALLDEAREVGVDAVIDQDLSLTRLTELPLHASTQCAIRTPDKARFYEGLGYSRIVLEREMSLDQIRSVRDAIDGELEFFVHGALCVCYSGQCYMSEKIAGRSANRGECIQACRSMYDLVDSSGKVLVRNKALLSLKDYNLVGRLEDLAEAGVDSFKIEGRLKNISYVRNVTRAYSIALDKMVERHPDLYRRASFGRVSGGFVPDLNKTFNRGYTELFLDGKRGKWSSMDAPKSMGEYVGTVELVEDAVSTRDRIRKAFSEDSSSYHGENDIVVTLRPEGRSLDLHNGDGFSFVSRTGEIIGFRGDVCKGSTIRCRDIPELFLGARIFRNLSTAFEKELETNVPTRTVPVEVDMTLSDRNDEKWLMVEATSQDGRTVRFERNAGSVTADNAERMRAMFQSQVGKATGTYSFSLRRLVEKTLDGKLPFLPASALNGIRRDLAERLDAIPCQAIPMKSVEARKASLPFQEVNDGEKVEGKTLGYKANVANHIAREIYTEHGATKAGDAYEISHEKEAELMRSKYCIRYELGLCPVHQGAKDSGPLFLVNNGRRYPLHFDCKRCEMTVLSD